MIEHPRAEELVQAVADWIDAIRPQLGARDAFLARAAVNALGIVAREFVQGPAAEVASAEQFSRLLGREADAKMLTSELCARLRTGEMDASTPGLLAALRAVTADRLAIDQPKYAPDASTAEIAPQAERR